jgi:hypothetical protein
MSMKKKIESCAEDAARFSVSLLRLPITLTNQWIERQVKLPPPTESERAEVIAYMDDLNRKRGYFDGAEVPLL